MDATARQHDKDAPPAKRYKQRNDTFDGNNQVVLHARTLKRRIDEDLGADEISRAAGYLDEAFMRDHQIYYVTSIVVDEKNTVYVLLSSHEKKTMLEDLLTRSIGIQSYATEAYIEDDERTTLLRVMHLDLLCHLDNVDYWVDYLITRHDVVFSFAGTQDVYLNDISKQPAAAVTNLDMQYLRQLTARMNTSKKIPPSEQFKCFNFKGVPRAK